MSRSTLRKIGAAASVAVALLAAGCSASAKASSSASDSARCPNGKIRFGIEPYEDAAKLTPAYKTVADAISKAMGCPVEVSVVSSYAAEVLAMKNGQLDLGEFGPLGFVFASQQANAKPIASFAKADGTLSSYTAGIWVPKSSPITSLAQLKGKSLALSSVGSASGDAFPRYALIKAGIKPTDVKIKYAGGHPESLLALTKGSVDAAEINSQQQASATAAHKIDISKYREIWKSEAIPNDPITVYGGLPQAFRDKVSKAVLSLSPETLKAVGSYLDVKPAGPMIAVTEANYSQLFDLAKTLGLTTKDL